MRYRNGDGSGRGKRVSLVAFAMLLLAAGGAQAYDAYSGGANGGCVDCHGDFRSSSYTSLSDGQSWGNLHNIHRFTILGGTCEACHRPGTTNAPVHTGRSEGALGLPTFSAGTNQGLSFGCAGCHGRSQDGAAQGNDPTQTAVGWGAGTRQRHWLANRTVNNISSRVCASCHADANPANYTPVGEDTFPAFYATPGSIATIPDDPCNPAGSENFAGATIGLDNDGDGSYDTTDTDCQAAPEGPGETAGAAVSPLIVTSRDAGAGSVGLSFGVACGTTANVVVWADLADLRALGSYDYLGQDCGLGVTGTGSWTYPTAVDQVWFLVVGDNGTVAGSYGTSQVGGVETERPADAVTVTCNNPPLAQALADRCDP